MRESVYICAASLCCCLVVCSLVRMIAPSNSTNKIMSVVISVFALCCLFSPIIELISDFDTGRYELNNVITVQKYSDAYDEEVLKSTAEYISEYICLLLDTGDIDVSEVKTIIGVDENRGIYIREINIYLDKDNIKYKDDVSSLLFSELGIKPKITEC